MNSYRVRVRQGDAEVEVESTDKAYVDAKLGEWSSRLSLGAIRERSASPGKEAAADEPVPAQTDGKGKSMVEHVRALAPKSGSQHVIAVGDYLERHGGMRDGFKTRDLVEGFRTVRYRHSNPAEAVRQAKQQGFLMDGKDPGSLILTQTAEAWVKGQLANEDEDDE